MYLFSHEIYVRKLLLYFKTPIVQEPRRFSEWNGSYFDLALVSVHYVFTRTLLIYLLSEWLIDRPTDRPNERLAMILYTIVSKAMLILFFFLFSFFNRENPSPRGINEGGIPLTFSQCLVNSSLYFQKCYVLIFFLKES